MPKSVLRYRERGEIGPEDRKRGPKKSRAEYPPTKEKNKDDNNNDDDNNEDMEDSYPYSKDPHRTAWDLM